MEASLSIITRAADAARGRIDGRLQAKLYQTAGRVEIEVRGTFNCQLVSRGCVRLRSGRLSCGTASRAGKPFPTGVNRHDSMALFDAVRPIRQPRGRPRKRPDKPHVGKGSDFPPCRRHLPTGPKTYGQGAWS